MLPQVERLRWLLEVIGWLRSELTSRLDIAESSAAQMWQGKRNIPNRAAVWLETLAAIHLSMPKPPLWDEQDDAVGRRRHVGGQSEEIERDLVGSAAAA